LLLCARFPSIDDNIVKWEQFHFLRKPILEIYRVGWLGICVALLGALIYHQTHPRNIKGNFLPRAQNNRLERVIIEDRSMSYTNSLLVVMLVTVIIVCLILMSPFILVFGLIVLVCFIIAIPSLIVFGIVYLIYKYGVKDRESRIPLILFVLLIVILSPILVCLLILLIPLAIIFLIGLASMLDQEEGSSRKSSGFSSSLGLVMGSAALTSSV